MTHTPVDAVISQHVRASRIHYTEIGAAAGITKQGVSDRVNGRVRWSAGELPPIATLLGVPVAELFEAGK